jgi:hypothetical protein
MVYAEFRSVAVAVKKLRGIEADSRSGQTQSEASLRCAALRRASSAVRYGTLSS